PRELQQDEGQWRNWQRTGLQNRRLRVRVPPALPTMTGGTRRWCISKPERIFASEYVCKCVRRRLWRRAFQRTQTERRGRPQRVLSDDSGDRTTRAASECRTEKGRHPQTQ